jgi:hypothetical protein
MVVFRHSGGLAAFALLQWVSTAMAEPVRCPASITVSQSVEAPPSGWTPSLVDRPRVLSSVEFFDGDPVHEASLVPDVQRKVKGKEEATWSFQPGGNPIWIGCRYVDAAVVLGKPLPTGTKECKITYGPGMIVETIECK